ncbi:hypothetical protein ABDI30_24115 [Paenibacillus cisolokensis]|uniref:hypothetical protein n=1 Tax=Paenibacillus cisolokensis TaxID=1658519 RepID=UPI003D2702DD
MKFTIVQLDSLSEQELMNGVTALYQQIFKTPKGLIEQLEGKPSWLAHVALDGSSVVGHIHRQFGRAEDHSGKETLGLSARSLN